MLFLNNEAIDAVNSGEDMPEILMVDGRPAFELKWHRTDAWRGYYNAVPLEGSGWEMLDESSWVTGDYEDAPEYARSSVVQRKLEQLGEDYEKQGYDIAVVFAPTSNVFSTGYDVFRRKR